MGQPKKLLYFSPFAFKDSTNGASVSMRELLRQLQLSGIKCVALTGDHIMGTRVRDNDCAAREHEKVSDKYYGMTVRSLDFDFFNSKNDALERLLREILADSRPDMVLTFLPKRLMPSIIHATDESDIPVAAYLSTKTRLLNPQLIRRLALTIVPSTFLADFYRRHYQIQSHIIYPTVVDSHVVTKRQDATFVTMINPSPRKGLTMFYKIAKCAQQQLPECRFLAVESRWGKNILNSRLPPITRLANVTFMKNQSDIRAVFAKTSILLFPSYVEEGFGRTILEAQCNGIPVIASRRGGIAEALNGAGISIDLTERLTTNFNRVPNDVEVQPWLEAIDLITTDQEVKRKLSRDACTAAKAITDKAISMGNKFAALLYT